MARKKIARNQGDSGRVNLSGSELMQFGGDIGEEIDVDVAESPAIAKAIIDSKAGDCFIIVSKADDESTENSG